MWIREAGKVLLSEIPVSYLSFWLFVLIQVTWSTIIVRTDFQQLKALFRNRSLTFAWPETKASFISGPSGCTGNKQFNLKWEKLQKKIIEKNQHGASLGCTIRPTTASTCWLVYQYFPCVYIAYCLKVWGRKYFLRMFLKELSFAQQSWIYLIKDIITVIYYYNFK